MPAVDEKDEHRIRSFFAAVDSLNLGDRLSQLGLVLLFSVLQHDLAGLGKHLADVVELHEGDGILELGFGSEFVQHRSFLAVSAVGSATAQGEAHGYSRSQKERVSSRLIHCLQNPPPGLCPNILLTPCAIAP